MSIKSASVTSSNFGGVAKLGAGFDGAGAAVARLYDQMIEYLKYICSQNLKLFS